MPLDAPYRLPQGIRPTVLVVRKGCLMLVAYDHRSLLIPVMTVIAAHNRHIIGIRSNNGEILRIHAFQIFLTGHRQPPSQRTTHPEPS